MGVIFAAGQSAVAMKMKEGTGRCIVKLEKNRGRDHRRQRRHGNSRLSLFRSNKDGSGSFFII